MNQSSTRNKKPAIKKDMRQQGQPFSEHGKVKILPLGGCGEIGMNMTIFAFDNSVYFVDAGTLFPDASIPSVDVIIPDVQYLLENRIMPTAWLITHGHEDHIGALPYLFQEFPAPIYASPFTLELIKEKFSEFGIKDVNYNLWQPFQTVSLPDLKLTPFPVNHSIADALGFFMETPYGNILHPGDFRIDYDPPEKSSTHHNIAQAVGEKPVHLLMADSTNSFSVGTDKSENSLTEGFIDLFSKAEGIVVVTTFASNIWRFQTCCDAAYKTGRKVLALGRSMVRNLMLAQKLKLLHVPAGLILTEDDPIPKDPAQLCVVCTGSQGEQFSGAARLASGGIEKLKLGVGDTVIFSARSIPGNERSIGVLINQFIKMGCHVETGKDTNVHVSGHAYQEDLKTVFNTAKPKYFMPLHGEYRHLQKHIELAHESGVLQGHTVLAENGDIVSLTLNSFEFVSSVHSGRDYVSQGVILKPDGEVMKLRTALAKSGMASVTFVYKKRTWELATLPTVILKGVPTSDESCKAGLDKVFLETLNFLKERKNIRKESLEDELKNRVKRHIDRISGSKVTVVVHLVDVP
jgi:ribonuclease J